MDKELQQEIARLISMVGDGFSFVKDELPDVISQLLLWHGIYSFISFILCMAFIASIWPLTRYLISKTPEKSEDSWHWESYPCSGAVMSSAAIAAWLAFGFVLICSLAVAISSINLEWLQILIAPKVWLLEYVSKMAG